VSAAGPVRWGILGTGAINARFLPGARQSEAAEFIAIGSRTQARADAFADQYAIERRHGSYEAFLADPDIEAVYLCLPNSLHHEWTMAALRAGKHVLCEKPYTRHPAEVDAAWDLADRSGLVVSEAFMWRHHPQARRMVGLLPEIGALQTVRAIFSWRATDEADVRLRSDLDGGSLMDVGCYCVSGARLLVGEEPDVVLGWATAGGHGVDVRFSGILHFPSGVVAEISSGFTADSRRLDAIGSAGTVTLLDPWNATPATMLRDGIPTEVEQVSPYRLEVDDISAAIREKRAPLLGRADALGQARTIEALYRSAATRAAVRV
jgi:D-xylose 1-dehydrogenase (NADP+, D-xylono-1,5-lactone-forming)